MWQESDKLPRLLARHVFHKSNLWAVGPRKLAHGTSQTWTMPKKYNMHHHKCHTSQAIQERIYQPSGVFVFRFRLNHLVRRFHFMYLDSVHIFPASTLLNWSSAKIMVGSKWFKTNTSRPNIDLDLIKTMPGTHLIDIIRGKQETFTRSMKSLQPAPVVENQEFQFQWYWMVLVLIRLTKTLTYVPRTTKL